MAGKPHRRIGGSDIPKLLGISKYGNAADVYMRIIEGAEPKWNKNMERGAAVEPVLRAHAQRVLGVEIEQTDVYAESKEYDFASAQIDDLGRRDGFPVVVEYKSQSMWAKGWGANDSDEIPEQYRAQVAWQLLCSDRGLALVVVGFGEDVKGEELFAISHVVSYELQRDGVYEAHLLDVAQTFWKAHIEPRIPPSIKPLGKYQVKP